MGAKQVMHAQDAGLRQDRLRHGAILARTQADTRRGPQSETGFTFFSRRRLAGWIPQRVVLEML